MSVHLINYLTLFSSCSTKSEPGTIYYGRSILLTDSIDNTPDDPNDALCRQRSTSFRRAIERGISGESNISYETINSGSSHESLDLPPYMEPPAFRHTTGAHDIPDLLHPYCTDNTLTTTQATAQYMCSTNR